MASSSVSRKRKRSGTGSKPTSSNGSFRKHFKDLRDTGLPDTGPKRPKNKRVTSLTSAAASSNARLRSGLPAVESEGGRSDSGQRGRRGRGRGRRESGGNRGHERRRSEVEKTPRTQLRADIRDLISSAVEQGDVTPAPPRTTLTPHELSSPQHTTSPPETNNQRTQSLSTTVTEMEVRRRTEVGSVAESYQPSALETPVVMEETPSSHSRALRSVLKGVHSLSSLRKRSIHASTAQTPHLVTFHDHITVAEYSPDKSGRSSADSTLDSTTLSPPAPTSQRDNTASGIEAEPGLSLEPLEEENEEEEEEEEEEDGEGEVEEGEEVVEDSEGEEMVEVRMKTPQLPQKTSKPSPRQKKTNSLRRPQKTATKCTTKQKETKENVPASSPPRTLARSLVKNLFMLSSKRRMTTDAAALIVKFSEVYLKRCSQDLATYAGHAGRKTIEVDDAILLMKRQRFIKDSETFEYLVNTHLPLEYVEELLPCTLAGKKIVPTRVK